MAEMDEGRKSTLELEKFGYKQELKRSLSVWELTAFGLNYIMPIGGVAVIAWVWSSMDKRTLIVGTIWLVIGIIYEVILTKGWRELPPQLEL